MDFIGSTQSLAKREDPKILAIFSDHAEFWRSNLLVNSYPVFHSLVLVSVIDFEADVKRLWPKGWFGV